MIDEHASAVAEHLEEAAEYIEDHGWCQHTMRDAEGKVCLLGAISRVGIEQRRYGTGGPATAAVAAYLYRESKPEYVPVWNDTPGRTGDEVVDLLKRTAKALRNGNLTAQEYSSLEARFVEACEMLVKGDIIMETALTG